MVTASFLDKSSDRVDNPKGYSCVVGSRYDIKGRKYIDTPAKYYFADMELRNARINFRQYEETHLMERYTMSSGCVA